MAIQERSLGCLYAAKVRLNKRWCPPHFSGIVEMEPPWHHGQALIVSFGRSTGFMFGFWIRRFSYDVYSERWLNAKLLNINIEEIAKWDKIDVEEKIEV